MELLNKFREMQLKMSAYGYVLNITGWDSATEAPKGAFARRAKLLGIISGEVFQLSTSKEYQDVVNGLFEQLSELEDSVQREIKKAKKKT
jgi:carboxypeptidase Taq